MNENKYDCIIAGAGPGGLQAAIHLARYNRKVLLIDKGGGRTRHAAHIVNYLGEDFITGKELIDTGFEQVKRFGVEVLRDTIKSVEKEQLFIVKTDGHEFRSDYLIVATGATETMPKLQNMHKFFGKSIITCITCDGHRTTGKKLVVAGNTLNAVRLVFAEKQMYTNDITLLLDGFEPPEDFLQEVEAEHVSIVRGSPVELLGEDSLTAVKLDNGKILDCRMMLISYGMTLNDEYLSSLPLKRDNESKILTNSHGESSVSGLYVTGALRPGHSQAIIAAGQGAQAAIDINANFLENSE